MTFKLITGFVLGTIFFIACIVFGFIIGSDWLSRSTNVLFALFGGTFGWIVGILISPAKNEVQEFEKIGGAILTFVSGYGLAKANDLFSAAATDGRMPDDSFIGRVLITLITFCIGALFSSVARKYWDEGKPKRPSPTRPTDSQPQQPS